MLEEESHDWRLSTRPEVAAADGLGLSCRNSLVVTASLSFALELSAREGLRCVVANPGLCRSARPVPHRQ
jgi:hypothetical protein